jgi:hypothetical protein
MSAPNIERVKTAELVGRVLHGSKKSDPVVSVKLEKDGCYTITLKCGIRIMSAQDAYMVEKEGGK